MRASKVDANQPEIVMALRYAGASVQHLHGVGSGCPDLVCGYRGQNYLIEVKDGSKPPSGRALTSDQVAWHGDWKGSVSVVKNIDEALRVIGVIA